MDAPQINHTQEVAKSAFWTTVSTVLKPFTVATRFCGDWLTTRHWRWFIISIPAQLIAVAIIVGTVRAHWAKDRVLSRSYAQRAVKHYEAKDYQRSEMLYRKAIQYQPHSQSLRFGHALILNEMDQTQEAFHVMQEIAPLDEEEKGYPDAHFWIAQALLLGHVEAPNSATLAEKHLRSVLRYIPGHIGSHRLMWRLAMQFRNGPAALKHLPHIVDKFPGDRIHYATILQAAKRTEEAHTQATVCFGYYQREILGRQHEGEPPAASEWLNWAKAAVILERYTVATNILEQALKSCEEKKLIRHGLSTVFVRWTEKLDKNPDPSIREQLKLLDRGLRVAPDNPLLLKRVALLLGRDDAADGIARKLLQKSLAEGTAPALVHFLLGTRKAAESSMADAESHLEQALSLNPNTPVVLNNLAWVLATRAENPDYSRALDLANQAVKLRPFNAHYHETRGQVLFKLGRWKEAITELEKALTQLKDRPEIHKSLAVAYRKIGNDPVASEHRHRLSILPAAERTRR